MEFQINGNYFIIFIRTIVLVGVVIAEKMYKMHKKAVPFEDSSPCVTFGKLRRT